MVHRFAAVDLAPVVLLEGEGYRLTIDVYDVYDVYDVNKGIVVPWGLWVEVQQLKELQKGR